MSKLDLHVEVSAPLSHAGSTLMSAPDLATALRLADEYIRGCNWDTREDRPCVRVEVSELCSKCGGNGRKLRPRHKMTYDDCKTCKGSGRTGVIFDSYVRDDAKGQPYSQPQPASREDS